MACLPWPAGTANQLHYIFSHRVVSETDSPGFRRREALLPNLYEPGQAHPVDGGFRLPCPRIPPNRLIAAALSHQVQLLISRAGTRIDPRCRRLPADPICSLLAVEVVQLE